jgi:hypothetical protein
VDGNLARHAAGPRSALLDGIREHLVPGIRLLGNRENLQDLARAMDDVYRWLT